MTDTHVNVRDDVYEENLRRAEQPMSWDGRQLRYRGIPLRHNNFNRSFERVFAEAKRGADVILVTGDLIDYPRAHIGLMSGGQHRHRLGEDWPYHADRNWFLCYYLLASGANYTAPVYTILGNDDWRLNPYSPFAPGTPSPPTLAHNYLDFPDEGQLKDILRHAHGPGHDTKFAYFRAWRCTPSQGNRRILHRRARFLRLAPIDIRIESVMWYLLLINPFLDFAFPLPGGQQVLMLDWGKNEEIYNFESAQDWMEFSQRAKNCLIPLQEWHVTQFARSSGAAKVIGIHAPPLGPSDQWSDSDLSERTKVFKRSEDSRMRKPDGTITRVENHSLCAVAPKGAPMGVAGLYGSIVERRDWFIRKVGEAGSGIQLVFSGHISPWAAARLPAGHRPRGEAAEVGHAFRSE